MHGNNGSPTEGGGGRSPEAGASGRGGEGEGSSPAAGAGGRGSESEGSSPAAGGDGGGDKGTPAKEAAVAAASRQQVEADAAVAAATAEQQWIAELTRARAELTAKVIRLGDHDVDIPQAVYEDSSMSGRCVFT